MTVPASVCLDFGLVSLRMGPNHNQRRQAVVECQDRVSI
jgi:hypothetical protein